MNWEELGLYKSEHTFYNVISSLKIGGDTVYGKYKSDRRNMSTL